MANTLRKVEKEVIIPRYMERKINYELCQDEAKMFFECAKHSRLGVVAACKEEHLKFTECSNKWFRDEKFRKEMEEEYLKKRQYYRDTGKPFEKSPFSRL